MPNIRLKDAYIIDLVNNSGYTFLEFVDDTHRRLLVMCNKGHKYEVHYSNFHRGTRCRKCMGLKSKKDFTYIQNYVAMTEECLLSTEDEYDNNKSFLRFKCSVGHLYTTTWNHFQQGSRCLKCSYVKRGNDRLGIKNKAWKGGVTKQQLPLYGTFIEKLNNYNNVYKVRRKDIDLLGVECLYCGKVFVPKLYNVKARIKAIDGKGTGEGNFYCSTNCKKACSIYGQIKYPKGFKPATSREVQPELRKMVLARDNHTCQKCYTDIKCVELHCHHIDPVSQNPVESADISNCITLCKKCHKQVHKLPDCGYNDLKCK